jgi:hypothetical protein
MITKSKYVKIIFVPIFIIGLTKDCQDELQ